MWRHEISWQRTMTYILLATLFTTILAKPECNTYPNYKTGEYTYTICTDTPATNLNTSRQFCQDNFESSDVITFPNEKEFNFITSVMNNTLADKEQFKYVPGFFQKKDEGSRFNPETGDYFWITDTKNRLTNESTSYWKPFENIILEFDANSLWLQQRATFLLDKQGKWYAGVSLGNGESFTPLGGGVICMETGVPKIVTSTPARIIDEDKPFEYWIAIAAAGGVILLGIIIACIIFCVLRKKKSTTKFNKVPQSESHNNNSPKQYSV